MSKYKKLDFSGIKTHSLADRASKVNLGDFVKVLQDQPSFQDFFAGLPNILAAKDFKNFIGFYRRAIEKGAPVLFMMGAHVIKVGLSPLLIDAMQRGWISHLAMNGAAVIHDVEIALCGATSEDVEQGLQDGSFGMARESTHLINEAVQNGKGKYGYAEAVSVSLEKTKAPYLELSVLHTAGQLRIPVTAHSAIGTEIIHQHPGVDAEAIGDTAWSDFQIFTHSVSTLTDESVVLNIGSAVILPEVFLKALTVVRNLGHPAFGFTSATFDMIRHYRPTVNVVERPTRPGGHGFYFIGHHEIMLPLLFTALKSF